MPLTISATLSDDFVEEIIRDIMENYPEAGRGNSLQCEDWDYDKLEFTFRDTEEAGEGEGEGEEDGKVYKLDKAKLVAAFPLMYTDKWPRGLARPPLAEDDKCGQWDRWLSNADAEYHDAFVQLACLGAVIYG